MRRKLLFLLFMAGSICALSEGTKELRPEEDDKGNLHLNNPAELGNGQRMYTDFGMYDAPGDQQIRIRVNSPDELVYLGMNNKEIDGGDDFITGVPFRIKDPDGNVVYTSTMPEQGEEGYINDWNEAVEGPAETGAAGGYDAIEFAPDMSGDYVIEFNPSGPMDIHLFDVTVTDASGTVVPGRLHSRGWQISTEAGGNEFNGKVYPYDPKGVVYEVDFNGMQPFTFIVNFNSVGTGNTGDHLKDRQSKIGGENFSIPEFEVFLNEPDSNIYPTFDRDVNFSGEVTGGSCAEKDYCLNFTSDVAGYLDGYIDVNKNGVADDGTDVFFSEYFPEDTTICVPWDGKDAAGNMVDKDDIKVFASYGLSVTHLPIFDAEENSEGLRVEIVGPEGLADPLLYWDDSNINDGNNIDDLVNISGCNSQGTGGCHRWEDRGDNDNPETINTWWYTEVVFDTLVLEQPENPAVSLSFLPDGPSVKDTIVCKGDTVDFYILNDESHYDPSVFKYTWFYNSLEAAGNTRHQKNEITSASEVVIRSELLSDETCFSFDTLNVEVVDSVILSGMSEDAGCTSPGSVEVTVEAAPPDPVFYWEEFPSASSGTLPEVPAGTYHVYVADPAFPEWCAAGDSFTVKTMPEPEIDSVSVRPSECHAATGEATVFVSPIGGDYEYDWGQFTNNSGHRTDIAPGAYTVSVIDQASGCTDEASYEILPLPFSVSAKVTDEVCQDGTGEITLTLPANNFKASWEDAPSAGSERTGLSAGRYDVQISSEISTSCTLDTGFTVQNIVEGFNIENLQVDPSDCGRPTGSAVITMPSDGIDYVFSWDSGAFTSDNSAGNLSVGEHEIRIREPGNDCVKDTSYFVPGDGFSYDVSSVDDICNSGEGKAEVQTYSTDVGIEWEGSSSSSYERTGLQQGSYVFILRNIHDENCVARGKAEVGSIMDSIATDFSWFVINGDGTTPENFEDIQFLNESEERAAYFSWSFGDGSTSGEENPVHYYDEGSEYTVTLEVEDDNGCIGRVSRPLRIDKRPDCNPAMPNAFSPNGDNMNEDIGVLGHAEGVELKIFNRWGEVIFRGNSLKDRWDGAYRGEQVPVGVYPYKVTFECLVGKDKTVVKEQVGQITLIR